MSEKLTRFVGAVFGLKAPVSRKLYVGVGFSLMLLKYLAEAGILFKATRMFFDPLAFLIPSMTYRAAILQEAPAWLPWAIAIWSLPFLWIAITMSVRRAIDAGQSPVFGLLVLIPVLNLLVMMMLALAPTAQVPAAGFDFEAAKKNNDNKHFYLTAILGVAIGGTFALGATFVCANMLHNYGYSLFLGMPIVSGAAAGFAYNQPYTRGIPGSLGVGMASVAIGGAGLLLFALEGVICLLMASPMLLPLGALGGLLGWFLSTVIMIQSKWMLGGAMLVVVPVMSVLEMAGGDYATHVVESSIVVDAPPSEVWQHVISFPDIDAPQPWYFKMGVAAPLRARIIGEGVGAVRHCEFTTGDFVEPITIWDEPNRLAFDVAEQPDPMIELTPYRHIRPPHLAHSFYSVKGEFELQDNLDGSTTLIGRTWYVVEMGPQFYWRHWTDTIIHRIHLRVLNHIDNNATQSNF